MLQQCAVAWQVVGHSSAASRESPPATFCLVVDLSALPEGNQKIVAILTPRLAKAKEKVDVATASLCLPHVSVGCSAQAHTHTSINTYAMHVCIERFT